MSRFTQTLLISRDPEVSIVRLSVATSEGRVDEITLVERDFKDVAAAMWEKTPHYQGGLVVRAKFNPESGYFTLSIQTGMHTRSVYRLAEHDVMPTLGQYMADTGGE
jgi:hypothetical protein